MSKYDAFQTAADSMEEATELLLMVKDGWKMTSEQQSQLAGLLSKCSNFLLEIQGAIAELSDKDEEENGVHASPEDFETAVFYTLENFSEELAESFNTYADEGC